MADIFSSLIAVGGFSFTNNETSYWGVSMYAVYTTSHTNKVQATESSESCKSLGGAGYVHLQNNTYYIIASIYENLEDAKKVKLNLIETKPSCDILELQIKKTTFSNNLKPEEKEVLNQSLSLFKNTYKKLYDLSVSLDTSIITEVNAQLSINEIGGEVSKVQNNFNTMFNDNLSSYLILIKTKLNSLNTTINNLINQKSYSLTSNIKYAYSSVVFSLKSLSEEL